MKYNGIFDKSITPEPGHYSVLNTFGSQKGFTLYSKLDLPKFSNTKNPGPGHYQSSVALNNSGRYVLSQMSNCPGYKIKPYKTFEVKDSNPGPGQYDCSAENMNPKGRYSTSKHENSRCRIFSKSSRGTLSKKEIPGPGAYNYIS